MRKSKLFTTVGACGAIALAIPALALAGGASSNAPKDFVVGGGQNNPPNPNSHIDHFAVNAQSGPAGENPKGEAHFVNTVEQPDGDGFWGDVTCVAVNGNEATVVFKVRHAKNADVFGDIMWIRDN